MNDSTDKRVSFAKGATKPGSGSGKGAGRTPARTVVPGGKVDVARPQTVLVVAALLIVSGLAAIVTGLALNGQHAYLVKNLRKNSPPVTTAQAGDAGTKVAAALQGALKAGSVSQADVTAAQKAVTDVIGDKNVIPSKSISGSDRSDQQDKAKAAVAAQVKAGSTLTSGSLSSAASSVSATVRQDLTTLGAKQAKDIESRANSLPRTVAIQGIVLTLALAFVAFGVYAGRYYSRWAVPVLWVLTTFMSLPAGLFSLLQLGASAPAGYKAASAVSGLALLVALAVNFMAPTRAWYDAHRPVPVPGAPQRRGLFAPRVPPPTGGSTGGRPLRGRDEIPAEPATPRGAKASGGAAKPAGRTKKRAVDVTASEPTADASRAARPRQASKSRRTEV